VTGVGGSLCVQMLQECRARGMITSLSPQYDASEVGGRSVRSKVIITLSAPLIHGPYEMIVRTILLSAARAGCLGDSRRCWRVVSRRGVGWMRSTLCSTTSSPTRRGV
jgi:hypothetical protein